MDNFPKLINSNDNSIITINNSSFSIGRSLSCDHIIDALGVSRFHCIIKKTNSKWTLYDKSTNGTVVNSKHYKCNESVELNSGDMIKLGPANLDYVFTDVKLDEEINSTLPGTSREEFVKDQALLAQEFETPFNVIEIATTSSKSDIPLEPPDKSPSVKAKKENFDIMENELTCSICAELFIKAVTLNCSHTYCKFCIDQWRKTKSTCPICRKMINSAAPTLVLDNFIEKIISTQNDEMKEMRKELIKQRDEIIVNTAGSSSNSSPNDNRSNINVSIIEILSEDEDDDEDEEDDDSDYYNYSDDHDYDVDECYSEGGRRRRGGGYYGGYGRCFICNDQGHWANTCPFKRR